MKWWVVTSASTRNRGIESSHKISFLKCLFIENIFNFLKIITHMRKRITYKFYRQFALLHVTIYFGTSYHKPIPISSNLLWRLTSACLITTGIQRNQSMKYVYATLPIILKITVIKGLPKQKLTYNHTAKLKISSCPKTKICWNQKISSHYQL